MKPDSPQSLPSLDHPSPTLDDLSHLPRCRKCCLTTKQHELAKVYICGHLCRDIAEDNFCPDIDALHLSRKDCPIHSPKEPSLTRRRSSLSKPPMLARDESTYQDVDDQQMPTGISKSPERKHPLEENEVPEEAKPVGDDPSRTCERPEYHVFCNARGDVDWRKHCRVEIAMQQMLFGDARVAPHIMLEQTQRLRGTANLSKAQNTWEEDDDKLRSAMAATKIEAENQIEERKSCGTTTADEIVELGSFKPAQGEPAKHDVDCAICSDGEDDEAEEEFRNAMSAARSTTKILGCASDDECSSCAEDAYSYVESRDFAPEEPPQRWMDRSRAC